MEPSFVLFFFFVCFFFHYVNLSEMRNSGSSSVLSFRAQSSNQIAVRKERGSVAPYNAFSVM